MGPQGPMWNCKNAPHPPTPMAAIAPRTAVAGLADPQTQVVA